MKPWRLRRTERAIAVVEILGGAAGLFLVWKLWAPSWFLLLLLFGAVAVCSIGAGLSLWNGSKAGRRVSLALQLLQVPALSLGVFAYELFFGLKLTLGIFGSRIAFAFHFGSAFTLTFPGAGPAGVGMNVIALAFAVFLSRQIKREDLFDESLPLATATVVER